MKVTGGRIASVILGVIMFVIGNLAHGEYTRVNELPEHDQTRITLPVHGRVYAKDDYKDRRALEFFFDFDWSSIHPDELTNVVTTFVEYNSVLRLHYRGTTSQGDVVISPEHRYDVAVEQYSADVTFDKSTGSFIISYIKGRLWMNFCRYIAIVFWLFGASCIVIPLLLALAPNLKRS